MTNPIEGAIYSAWEDSATGSQEYDEQGYSSTWRQAIFAVSVLSEEDFKYIEKPGLESLLYNLELLVEACKDNLDVPDAEILWEEKGSHARESCARVLFQIEELIVKLQSTDEGAESVVPLGTRKMLREATLRKAFEGAIGRTRKSVFNARVLARMLSEKEDSAQSSDSITASWIDQIGQDFTNRKCTRLLRRPKTNVKSGFKWCSLRSHPLDWKYPIKPASENSQTNNSTLVRQVARGGNGEVRLPQSAPQQGRG